MEIDLKLDYVLLEPLGDDEQGVDIWIGKKNGTKEGQQCKGRNGSKEKRKSVMYLFSCDMHMKEKLLLVTGTVYLLFLQPL